MARRFARAVRTVEVIGAAVAVAILAILFLPRHSGSADAAPAVIEQPDLNVAVVPRPIPLVSSSLCTKACSRRAACTSPSSASVPRRSSTPRRSTSQATGSTSPAATTSVTSRRRKNYDRGQRLPRSTMPWSPPT